ncbi:MAG: cardiolipin synthase, partial [Bacteroidales bacterium]|nr:cardiolipin synthase [Bacteroidales bacterium]
MVYVHWIFFALYVCIVVSAAVAVLMDNRQPAKTLAWLLVLIFLPVVGLVFYFFFGQNTRKERFISQQSMDQLTKRSMFNFAEQQNLVVPKEHDMLVKLFAMHNWALPFKDNEVEIFCCGYDFFHRLLRELGRATHHIHLETYIICDDPLGRLLTDVLIDKARQGVEVRFIYDDVGCWNVPNSFFERMRNAGIEVHAFMPVKFPAFTSKVNYRNHRKLCVIDGQRGFIGGMNMAMRYIKGRHGEGWRDTHLMVRGGAVYGIQRAFLVDWYFVDRTLISNRCYYPPITGITPNNCLLQIVTSSPVSPWPEMEQGYVRILLEARQYVYMQTPYFLPTDAVLFAMRTAALAGVDVRLIVPLRTDALFVDWASRSFVRESV